jgi:hypothetical protein
MVLNVEVVIQQARVLHTSTQHGQKHQHLTCMVDSQTPDN